MALPTTIETMLTAVNNLLGTIDGKLRNKASKTELADGLALKANKSETLTPAEIEARIPVSYTHLTLPTILRV